MSVTLSIDFISSSLISFSCAERVAAIVASRPDRRVADDLHNQAPAERRARWAFAGNNLFPTEFACLPGPQMRPGDTLRGVWNVNGIGATRPDEKRWGRWSNDDSLQAETGSRQPGAPAKSITAANRGWMARKILSLAGQVKCFFLTSPFIEPAGAAGVEPVQLV